MLRVRVVADHSPLFEVRSPNRETNAALEAAARGGVTRFSTVADLMADLNDDVD